MIGGLISTVAYAITSIATGHDVTASGAAGAFVGGAVAGAVSIVATPLAGTLLGAVGIVATDTAILAGATAINGAGGVASYFAGGYTQNAVDQSIGNKPAFEPNFPAAATSGGISAILTPFLSVHLPAPSATMRTLEQARYFYPGITSGTTQNLIKQAAVSAGVGTVLGTGLSNVEETGGILKIV